MVIGAANGEKPYVLSGVNGATRLSDGRIVIAKLPRRFFPFEFGDGWILGVSFDDLNVERVEVRRVVPGPLSGRVFSPADAAPPFVTAGRCGVWTSR